MADENIEIEVQDKVSESISTKLKNIAREARGADSAVKLLQESLNSVSASGLSRLQNELNRTAISQQRLATETQKTQAAMANVETALNRAIAAETNAATAAQRLATEQQKTAQAAQRAAAAATQSQTATQNLATATTRATTAQTQGATAAQRLATEQQRTAQQAANAAAANDRAALAALRLQQAQDRAATSSASLTSRLMSLRNIATLVVSALGINAYANMTSQFTDLEARVTRVVGSAENATAVLGELNTMARRTYSEFNLTAESYLANSTALTELGYSTRQQLDYTEALNNALVVSGAKAQQAERVQYALSKSMALGVLRGQELNAVIETGGRVAELIANEMGVATSELRRLGAQGKITGDIIYSALAGNLELTRKEAEAMPATIADGMLLIRDAISGAITDFDKMTGISATVAEGLVWIADNLKVVAFAATVAGSSLLVAFGPALLTALKAATGAVLSFTAVLAANPIGLLVVGISAAISAIIFFGDKIKVTSDGIVSLKDAALAAWSYISDAATWAAETISEIWQSLFGNMNFQIEGFGEFFSEIFSTITNIAKTVTNFIIGYYVGLFNAIKVVWQNFPTLMKGFFASVVNFGATAAETLMNSWQLVLRGISSLIARVAPDTAAAIDSALDRVSIELPRMEVEQGAKDAANAIGDAFRESQRDYLGAMGDDFNQRMRKIAADRAALQAASGVDLDKPGVRTVSDIDENAVKELEKLKEALAKVRAEVSPSADALKRLSDAQDVLNKSIAAGLIVQNEADLIMQRLRERYRDALDPIGAVNRELQQELRLMNMLPAAREVEQRMIQIENSLREKNVELTAEQNAEIRQQLALMQERQRVMQQEAALLSQGYGQRQAFIDQLQAIKNLQADPASGFTAGDAAGASMGMLGNMGIDTSQMQGQLNAQLEMQQTYFNQLEEMRRNNLISEQDYSNARAQLVVRENQLKTQQFRNFFDGLATLQSSNIRELAHIGKAAAVTQAIINTYEGATKALAQGGIYGAAMAAVVVASGMAQVAQIQSQNVGFKSGGYTGNIGVDEVAGVVHGQEFVMNAAATDRIGVENLQALQTGAATVQRGPEDGYNVGNGQGSSEPPEVNVDVPISAIVVSSKEAALAAMKSSDGRAFIMEVLEENSTTVARIAGVR